MVLNDIKEDLIELIISKSKFKETSYYKKGRSSNDWYEPDIPSEYELNFTMVISLSDIEDKFGVLSEDDIEDIREFLDEDEKINEFYSLHLDEIKPEEMEEITHCVDVSIKNKKIIIEITVEDFVAGF